MKFIKNKKSGYVNVIAIVVLAVISVIIAKGYLIITKENPVKFPIENYTESTIQTDVEVVKVIYDEGYEITNLTMVDDKGTLIPITNTYPDTFTTIVKHEDHTHSIGGKELYNFCKDTIYSTIKANINLRTYKNGKEKHTIDVILE